MWRRSHFLPATPAAPTGAAPEAVDAADDVYDGPATLRFGAAEHGVRVRLTGHLDPTDGRYHWRGTVFETLPDDALRTPRVTLTIGERTTDARLTERTPWDTYSIVGEGAPPFA
jgi:hypothetical protein